jgi:hypothetical protein
MIHRFNRVSGWIVTEVLKGETVKQRTGIIAKFIEVAEVGKFIHYFYFD